MNLTDLNLAAATPEIFLAVSGLVLLILGVFQGDKFTRPLSWLEVGGQLKHLYEKLLQTSS